MMDTSRLASKASMADCTEVETAMGRQIQAVGNLIALAGSAEMRLHAMLQRFAPQPEQGQSTKDAPQAVPAGALGALESRLTELGHALGRLNSLSERASNIA
jgi:hypothetical protein